MALKSRINGSGMKSNHKTTIEALEGAVVNLCVRGGERKQRARIG